MDGLIQPTDDWMIVANHGCHRLYGRARLLGIGAGAAVAVAFAAIVIHGYLVPAKAEFRSVVQDVLADSNGTGLVVIRPAVMIFPILYYSGTLSPTNQLRLRSNDGVPERELLAEIRSTRGFWIVDVLPTGEGLPNDLEETAIDVGGHIGEVREYFGICVARVISGRWPMFGPLVRRSTSQATPAHSEPRITWGARLLRRSRSARGLRYWGGACSISAIR